MTDKEEKAMQEMDFVQAEIEKIDKALLPLSGRDMQQLNRELGVWVERLKAGQPTKDELRQCEAWFLRNFGKTTADYVKLGDRQQALKYRAGCIFFQCVTDKERNTQL